MRPPSLLRFQTSLPDDVEGALDALDDARSALQEVRAELRAQAQEIPLRDEGVGRVNAVSAALDNVARSVETAAAELAAGSVSDRTLIALEQSTEELDLARLQLDTFARTRPPLAPLPLVARTLVTAVNVMDGLAADDDLRARLPALASTAHGYALDARLFNELHAGTSGLQSGSRGRVVTLAQDFAGDVRNFLIAVEAMHAWAQGRAALLDVLKLLRGTSIALARRQAEVAEYVRADASWSVVALEELNRSLAAPSLPRDLMEHAAANVAGLLTFLEEFAGGMNTAPLAFVMREQIAQFEVQVNDVKAQLHPILEAVHGARPIDRGQCRDASRVLEEAVATHKMLQQALDAATGPLASAPSVLDVVVVMGRVANLQAQPLQARWRLQRFLEQHEKLYNELADAPDSFEVRIQLSEQAEALVEMSRYLDDFNEDHMRGGLERLHVVVPAISALQAELMAGAEAQRRDREQGVRCMYCGASNATGARYCGSCNAVLMTTISQSSVEYTDIVGGEDRMELPANLRKCQQICVAAEVSGDFDSAAMELQKMLDRMKAVQTECHQKFLTRNLTEHAAEYGTALSQCLDQIVAALGITRMGALAQDPPAMMAGLKQTIEVGLQMQQLRLHMQENVTP